RERQEVDCRPIMPSIWGMPVKAGAARLAALAAPRIGQAARTTSWSLCPPWISASSTRSSPARSRGNHVYLVFATLYGIDTNRTAQPRMVEGHQVEEDGFKPVTGGEKCEQ